MERRKQPAKGLTEKEGEFSFFFRFHPSTPAPPAASRLTSTAATTAAATAVDGGEPHTPGGCPASSRRVVMVAVCCPRSIGPILPLRRSLVHADSTRPCGLPNAKKFCPPEWILKAPRQPNPAPPPRRQCYQRHCLTLCLTLPISTPETLVFQGSGGEGS